MQVLSLFCLTYIFICLTFFFLIFIFYSTYYVFHDILISQGCCNKLLQISYLKTAEIYSLTVLEAINLNSRCQKSHAPSDISRREFFLASSQLLVVPGNHWQFLTFICITIISDSVFTGPLYLCLRSLLFFLIIYIFMITQHSAQVPKIQKKTFQLTIVIPLSKVLGHSPTLADMFPSLDCPRIAPFHCLYYYSTYVL